MCLLYVGRLWVSTFPRENLIARNLGINKEIESVGETNEKPHILYYKFNKAFGCMFSLISQVNPYPQIASEFHKLDKNFDITEENVWKYIRSGCLCSGFCFDKIKLCPYKQLIFVTRTL